jgi:hypothetical protein
VVRIADLSGSIGALQTLQLAGGWRAGKVTKNVACKYRVTATIEVDTICELEIIKADLVRAGAKILRIDPIMIIAEGPPELPKHAVQPGISLKSLVGGLQGLLET